MKQIFNIILLSVFSTTVFSINIDEYFYFNIDQIFKKEIEAKEKPAIENLCDLVNDFQKGKKLYKNKDTKLDKKSSNFDDKKKTVKRQKDRDDKAFRDGEIQGNRSLQTAYLLRNSNTII